MIHSPCARTNRWVQQLSGATIRLIAFVLAGIEFTSNAGEITFGHFQESLLVLKLSSIDFFFNSSDNNGGVSPKSKEAQFKFCFFSINWELLCLPYSDVVKIKI